MAFVWAARETQDQNGKTVTKVRLISSRVTRRRINIWHRCARIIVVRAFEINLYIYSQTSLDLPWNTTVMRDHLSWKTTYSWQNLGNTFQCLEPVIKDHLPWETTTLWPIRWSLKTGSTAKRNNYKHILIITLHSNRHAMRKASINSSWQSPGYNAELLLD